MIRPRPAPVLFLGVQAPRLRPQVEHAEVGGVVEPERRLLQLVAGPHHLRPVFRRDLSLAQLVARDPRPAGDEALGQLDLRHLQREEGDRQIPLHGDVFGDVGDDRAVVDDDVVGDEIPQSRYIEIVGLFFTDILDRLDFVPPDVRVAELLQGRRCDCASSVRRPAHAKEPAHLHASCDCAADLSAR